MKSRSTVGNALIYPPSHLGLPALRISAFRYEQESIFGEGNSLYINMRLKTSKGYDWVPVAVLETNEKAVIPQKAVFMGTPAADNFKFVKPGELQVRKQGNTMFIGWTVQIPLPPTTHILPPACMMLEAYGKPNHVIKSASLGNYIQTYESDNFDAFVTFLDPSWKYSAPGTDGSICINVDLAITKPKIDNA
jgi:hypothetical protein